MSNGGEMCYLLAYSRQSTFRAVAPIAGLTMEWMPKAYTRTRPIPLFEVHGTEDRTSEWTGDLGNKGGWGAYIAVPDAVDYWVKRNVCNEELREQLPLKSPDSHQVIAHRYIDREHGNDVWLYEIIGGGHTWGEKDLDIAEEIWKFFSKFTE
jgi:polyhydroxybutyrate depolymerase